MKNNNHLKSIFKENVEKFNTTNKRFEKLKRMFEENKLKTHFDVIKDIDRKYAETTLLINNQEKNLFGNLLKDVVNENEDEVKKNEKTKNALLTCIRNNFKKINYDKIDSEEVKEGIEYIKNKYIDSLKNDGKNANEKMTKLNKVLSKLYLNKYIFKFLKLIQTIKIFLQIKERGAPF